MVGKPVNITTGNMYTQQDDLSYPSAFGRFAFTRTYNSQSTFNGPLGLGWTHPYLFEHLEVQPGVIRLRNGAGTIRFYEPAPGSTDTYRVTAPARETSTLVKHAAGYTEREQSGLRREFDTSGRLNQIVTRSGWTTTLTYSGTQLTSVTDPGGRTLSFSYTGDRLGRVDGPGGLYVEYGYDAQNRLINASDALGVRWRYTYADTSPSRLAGVQDGNGNWVEQHTYDSEDRVVATSGAGATKALTLEYLDSSHTRVTDSLGRVTTYTFGAFGDLLLVTQIQGPCPCGQPDSTFTYDVQGRLLATTDARGNTSQHEYDSAGNLIKITDALGQVTTYAHNIFGQVVTETDPTGAATAYEYDSATGFPVRITNGLGHVTTLTPDVRQLPGVLTDPRGNATTLTYGTDGLLAARTDPAGASTSFAYDASGRLVQITDALGGKTASTFDARGQLLSVTDPVGAKTLFTSDGVGNRVSQTDPKGRTTAYVYDAANQLTQVTDPAGGTTRFTYDSEGNLLTLTDARGSTTAFAYDAHNRLVRRTDPLGTTEVFQYDGAGNLVSRTDRKGQSLTYTYDSLNRLIAKTLPDTTVITYTYDPLGRLLLAADTNGTLRFTYDALGRIVTTTSQDGRTLSYTYDASGNRVGLQDETGASTTYVYDPRNLLTSLTDPRTGVFSFTYDQLGRRGSLLRPNGTQTSYSYDPASRLLALTHTGPGGTFENFTYSYDPAGNRVEDARNSTAQLYGYDALDQLTEVQRRGPRGRVNPKEAYTYDPVGNRLTDLQGSAYTYDLANRLTSDGSFAYRFDANGNHVEQQSLTDGTVNTYAYDAENRLIRVVTPTAEVDFRYDPLGRRTEKRVVRWQDADGDAEPDPEEEGPPRVTKYLYDQEDILATFTRNGRERARYTHGPGIDEPLADTRRVGTRFYHADVLGSVIALSDSVGLPRRDYRYSAFGVPQDHRGDAQPYRFTGREWDREIGLYYYRARYYSHTTGRFTGEDPLGFIAGTNLYGYVLNNPLSFTDPVGLRAIPFSIRGPVGSYQTGGPYRRDAPGAPPRPGWGAGARDRFEFYENQSDLLDEMMSWQEFYPRLDELSKRKRCRAAAMTLDEMKALSDLLNRYPTNTCTPEDPFGKGPPPLLRPAECD
jgi:RHS repeat-associated protein